MGTGCVTRPPRLGGAHGDVASEDHQLLFTGHTILGLLGIPMLSPGMMEVLAEVVASDFRLGSGCCHQPEPNIPPMTNDMMNLRDLVEKTPEADLLREVIDVAAHRLMELEVVAAVAAGFGENDPSQWSACHRQSTRTLPPLPRSTLSPRR
jgi:hypothetical protein